MRQENRNCLVLNSDYTPLALIDWKRAVTLAARHDYCPKLGVVILDFYKNDFIVGVNNKKIPIPAVVRTVKYFRINKRAITFSRKNVFLRDNFTCQYCSNQFDINKLTYDHVIPKSKWDYSKGTPTTWYNIVTSCVSCNRKKGDKTLIQAKMAVKNIPIKPNNSNKFLKIYEYLNNIKDSLPEEWKLYITYA